MQASSKGLLQFNKKWRNGELEVIKLQKISIKSTESTHFRKAEGLPIILIVHGT